MIPAARAEKIMQLYEEDYDNFLDKLRAKRKAKKEAANQNQAAAQKADKNLEEAEAHKKTHLKDKAKALLEKNGGLTGITGTAHNVLKYFNDTTPSDYDVNIGKDEPLPDDKIMGLPKVGFYTGLGIVVVAILFAASQMMKSTPRLITSIPPAA